MAHIRLMPTFSQGSAGGGKCYVSGVNQRHTNRTDPTSPLEPVVDLDTEISHEGNLEISLDTAKEIASVIGCISEEQAEALKAEVQYWTDVAADYAQTLAEKQATVDAFAGEIRSSAKALAQAKEIAWAKGYEQGCHDSDVVEPV